MAATVLRAPAADGGWLVVAGNAHTLSTASDLGEPLGLHVASVRPGVRSIEVRYQSGGFYNNGPRRFTLFNAGPRRFPSIAPRGSARLHLDHGRLVLDVAEAHEADVPQGQHDTVAPRSGQRGPVTTPDPDCSTRSIATAARWGRRTWQSARSHGPDDRLAGCRSATSHRARGLGRSGSAVWLGSSRGSPSRSTWSGPEPTGTPRVRLRHLLLAVRPSMSRAAWNLGDDPR